MNKPVKKKKCLKRQNGLCLYCLSPISLQEATLDHIVPLSKGGNRSDMDNLIAACSKCNVIKDSFATEAEVDEYAAQVKAMLKRANSFIANGYKL